MRKKIVSVWLTLCMVVILAPMALAAGETVAKINDTPYDSFADAFTAAKAMTGDVTMEIYGEVAFVNGMELKNGNYSSITFTGKTSTAKITINQSAGGDYLEAHGKTVVFNDLILAKANPAWSGNSGHMGDYFSIQGGTTTYNNCKFVNGACASSGTAIYNNCTFNNTSQYGLWVYDDALVSVNGGTIDSKKGIKVYSEGETSVTSTLTVQNATFTENITGKPAVAIGYAESITLIGNTYNNDTGVLELDSGSDANCEGILFVAKDAQGNDIASSLTAIDRSNSDAPCGVLMDGKIYTSVTTAKEDAAIGDTVTLLYPSTETVELPAGIILNKNGYTAENVTVETFVAQINTQKYTNLYDAISAVQLGETILLLNDYALTASDIQLSTGSLFIPSDKEFTLDLNGYALTHSSTTPGHAMITNRGKLTIIDSSAQKTGNITYTYNGTPDASFSKGNYTIVNSGTLNIYAGTIELTTEPASISHMRDAIDNNSTSYDAIVNIYDGNIICRGYIAIRQYANSAAKVNEVNIYGGTIIGGKRAIWVHLPGSSASSQKKASLSIEDGTLATLDEENQPAIYVYSYGDSAANTEISISGGIINGDVSLSSEVTSTIQEDHLSVTGGTFNGPNGIIVYGASDLSEPLTFISGGTFSADLNEYCKEGFVLTPTSNGTWGVITEEQLQQQIQQQIEADRLEKLGNYLFQAYFRLYNQTFHIAAFAAEGGSISSAGTSEVKFSKGITYTITPNEGYLIADVVVDGKSVGATDSYSFNNVKENHTIVAVFEKEPWKNPYADLKTSDWYYDDVAYVSEQGLMVGTDTDSSVFSADLALNRATLITILWRLEDTPAAPFKANFSDVGANEWYSTAMNWAVEVGLLGGYEDNTLRPTADITREQVFAILHRYADYKNLKASTASTATISYLYTDWAKSDVTWAVESGLLDNIEVDLSNLSAASNRAEIAAYLSRFCAAFMD